MTDPRSDKYSHRILFLMPNWLGDTIMATGLLQHLHSTFSQPGLPKIHLTLGVRKSWSSLFQNDPRLDDVFLIERPGRHQGLRGLFHLAQDFRRGQFTGVVLGPPSLRVALASKWAGIPVRVGFKSDGRGFLLSHGLDPRPRGEQHFFQELLDLGQVLYEAMELTVKVPPSPATTSLPGIEKQEIRLAAGAGRWVLAPGTTYGLAKTWPLKPALDFAELALKQGKELVLLGDAGASGFARDLAQGLKRKPRTGTSGEPGLVDLTGRTSLAEVVVHLDQAEAFVGNDSGLMHLAAALGVPTLGIFGSSNTRWTAPLGRQARALSAEGFSCQPCYLRTCNQAEFCLDTISGQQVFDELMDLLKSGPVPSGDRA